MQRTKSSAKLTSGSLVPLTARGIALALAVAAAMVTAGAGGSAADRSVDVGVAASRIYLDPETATLTAERPRSLYALEITSAEARMLSRSSAGLGQVALSGGGAYVELDGRFRHMQAVSIRPDGRMSGHCLSGGLPAEGHRGR